MGLPLTLAPHNRKSIRVNGRLDPQTAQTDLLFLQLIRSVQRENVLAPIKEHDFLMTDKEITHEYYGCWRIIETALISLTGEAGRP